MPQRITLTTHTALVRFGAITYKYKRRQIYSNLILKHCDCDKYRKFGPQGVFTDHGKLYVIIIIQTTRTYKYTTRQRYSNLILEHKIVINTESLALKGSS